MNNEDHYGFWDDDRSYSLTGRNARPQRAVRQHTPSPSSPSSRSALGRADRPSMALFWSRIGLLAMVGVLAISVALAVSSESTLSRVAAGAAQARQLTNSLAVSNAAATQVVAERIAAEATTVATATVAPTVTPTAAPPIPVVAAPPVQAAAAPVPKSKPTCAKSYKVVALDYWILIAKKVSVSLKSLLAANQANTKTALYPGRTVCLPANASLPKPVASTTTTAKPKPKQTATTTATTTKTTTKTSGSKAKVPTTTQPAVPDAPPLRSFSAAEVEQIIRDIWPDELEDQALMIAQRESHLRPSVRNWCCIGLFQIYWGANQRFLSTLGISSAAMLYDPSTNANAAYAMYLRSGWGPWS